MNPEVKYEEFDDDDVKDVAGNYPESDGTDSDDLSEEIAKDEDEEKKFVKVKAELQKYYKKKLPPLTSEQWAIIDYVIDLLSRPEFRRHNPTAVFIDGCLGSGKTEVLKIICEYVVKRFCKKKAKFISKNAIFAASYGVAALNYSKGRTAHSHFGFPLDLKDDSSYWNLTREKNEWELNQLEQCTIIVYDEVTSADKRYIHMLDRSLQRLMVSEFKEFISDSESGTDSETGSESEPESGKLFGGKIILFAGDFRQLAPVVEGARIDEKELILKASLISSPLWNNLKTFQLSSNVRIKTDKVYSEFLMKLGNGQVEGVKVENIPDMTLVPLIKKINHTTVLANLVNFVYPADILRNPDSATKRAILVPRNRESTIINQEIVQNYLEGNITSCYATDDQQTKGYLAEYESILDTLHEDKVFPDFDLQLKKGALCMIIRTMYKPTPLLNGAKVIVEEILDDIIKVRIPGKSGKTKVLYDLMRMKFEAHVIIKSKVVKLTRVQFPLKVCYAVTMHKSQGQDLRVIGLDLRRPRGFPTAIFRHGQLHMALGRVRYAKDVMVLVDEDQVKDGVAYTHNMVHPELVERYLDKAEKVDIQEVKEEPNQSMDSMDTE